MIIRTYVENDLDRMMEIWLEGSKQAHNFIDEDYWESNQIAMKDVYLPMSQSYVIEVDGVIKGFISMVDNYLAALFVDTNEQGKGYGKILLDHVKDQKETVDLKVYQENKNAIRFYQKNSFSISTESIDENTSAKEYAMTWRKE
ncbi:N-acetyltransferase [Paenibacillus sp. SYP-B3998]|uniref:N-acetyltransferase n=1 Tax=Paenibacillus sp. SYP-B3998 TaxID=2678564 RepID=A0A6G3ZSQ3_9BACL|nr:N-acetyltransferase [Paenibacillus sp. SYP-B3998]NEW04619.1 N-acetyltransferase [Paenibacillus sp. SYP-B3998]